MANRGHLREHAGWRIDELLGEEGDGGGRGGRAPRRRELAPQQTSSARRELGSRRCDLDRGGRAPRGASWVHGGRAPRGASWIRCSASSPSSTADCPLPELRCGRAFAAGVRRGLRVQMKGQSRSDDVRLRRGSRGRRRWRLGNQRRYKSFPQGKGNPNLISRLPLRNKQAPHGVVVAASTMVCESLHFPVHLPPAAEEG